MKVIFFLLIVAVIIGVWWRRRADSRWAPGQAVALARKDRRLALILELRRRIVSVLSTSSARGASALTSDLDQLVCALTNTMRVHSMLEEHVVQGEGDPAQLQAAADRIDLAAERTLEHFNEALSGLIEMIGVDLIPDVEPLREYLAARRNVLLATVVVRGNVLLQPLLKSAASTSSDAQMRGT